MGAPRRHHPQSAGGTNRYRWGNTIITLRANEAHYFPIWDHGEGQIAFFAVVGKCHLTKVSPILTLRHRSASRTGSGEDQIGRPVKTIQPLLMRSHEHIDNFATGMARLFMGKRRFRILHISMLPDGLMAVRAFDGHVLQIGAHGRKCRKLAPRRQLGFDSPADGGTIRIHTSCTQKRRLRSSFIE